ncbi:acyltransferase family protein [Spirosoma sp. KUDC1026]|uniref:acyltransferase family protein n=1 Tax=Spirosoma sp. KUDC1026 TaxID=2745947 RepID=UPI00159BBEFC|nr:acyltransferase [Spirosoma sp. KUDC1026]QKZ13333.1 acyltransferase [Spirosoma sp. KUDC1026]
MTLPTFYTTPWETQYVPALTGLRALAAYSVFLHHYNPAPTGTFAYYLFQQGYIGVTVFFVLSGFLMYHRYAGSYVNGQGWSWRAYLQQRFARLMPLYLFLLVAMIGGQYVAGKPMDLPKQVLNLTLLKGFFNESKFSGIAQSWSLTVEWTFYLLAPWLFTALHRWGLIRLTVILLSVGLLLWATVGQSAGHGLFATLPFVLFYTFFGRAFEFLIGMQLARNWRSNQIATSKYALAISLILISSCVVWQACVYTVFADNSARLLSEFVTYNLLLPVGIVSLLLSLLRENSIFSRVLASPVFQALGRSSYAFYLIHVGVVSRALLRTGLFANTWLLFGALVLLAHGLYSWIERPLHRWLALNQLQASPSIP